MSKNLFDEFPKVSTKEWKQKINLDLKGKDYNETLIWNSADGIDVKPYYDEQDLETSLPSTSVYPSTWKITQSIFVNDSGKSNHIAKQYLENGAESLCFVVGEKDFEIESLLKDIDLEKHTVIFKVAASNDSDKIINKILDFFQRRDLSIPLIELDVISNFAETGNWQHSKEQDWEVENNYFQKNATISVDLSLYQNAGANMV
ncbi:MAG: methylmalonyl-CoA mutase family protein, partial [Flavobacteriaceae bacterium]|nr:methylmalonyl-CoA mutase family protein [Flavobacteriaceae bacterium]